MYQPKHLMKHNPFDNQKILIHKLIHSKGAKVMLISGALIILSTVVDFDYHQKWENDEVFSISHVDLGEKQMRSNVYTEIASKAIYFHVRELTEEEKYIQFYSDIYSLKSEIVYQILSDMTHQFKDEKYVDDYVIGDSMMKGRTVICNSKEMAILIAVRNIAHHPNDYGFTKEEIETGVEYISDLDYTHQIAYVSRVLGVDVALNYAICRAETSFRSSLFLNAHNPSGIKYNGEYAHFPSFMAGFIDQALELLKYQIDGKKTIEEIGNKHAPVIIPEEPVVPPESSLEEQTAEAIIPENSNWVPNVTSCYQYALAHYEELFGQEQENEMVMVK